MILHTIVSLNEVLAAGNRPPSYEYIRRDGCLLQCIRGEDGLHIDRIISTDLRDYLKPANQVGTLLKK